MDNDLIPASQMKDLIAGTNDQYWATLRHKGGGPEYIKVGPRKVFYSVATVMAWLDANRYTRTDRPVSA